MPRCSSPWRTLYTLNGFGHRVLEELQRWDGGAWVTESATSHDYSTRCQLDKMTGGAGSARPHRSADRHHRLRVRRAFNRRTTVTDPNGVETETVYDELDRVRFLIQHGADPTEDLVTEHVYDVFGDLFQTILPEGNVIEYGYDHAGRLTSIEGKPDADPSSHGERTFYTLDGFGHRVLEELQRWEGAGRRGTR